MGLTALSAAKQNRRRLSTAGVARSYRPLTAAACFAISPLAVWNSVGAAVLVCILWSASLLPLCICTRIVVAISFHQIDNTPNAKTCANSHNESLQNGNRLIKEFHILFSPDRRFDEYLRFQKESGLAHLRCCPLPAILASPFIFNKVSLLESHDRWWLFRVGHTDHLFRVCPNGWEGVSLAVDKSLLPYPCACSVTSTS